MSGFKLKFISGIIDQDEVDHPATRERYRAMMVENHAASKPVYCQCCPQNAELLKLSVVLSESYFLRRFPGTAEMHDPECLFGFETTRPPTSKSSIPGLLRNADGSLKLTIDPKIFPIKGELRAERADVAKQKEGEEAARAKSTRGTLTQLGVLRLLLEEAGMTEWIPAFLGKRTAKHFMRRLQSVAQHATFGRGLTLDDAIIWPNRVLFDPDILDRLKNSPIKGRGTEREILIVGQLLNARPSASGKTMVLRLDWHRSLYLCDLPTWAEIKRQNERALIRDEDGNLKHDVLVMMTVRLVTLGKGTFVKQLLYAKTCAAVIVSQYMVPVDSGYEERAADYLVESGRSFRKPIRYDKSDEMFPDFILTDTSPETNVEVWGMQTPEYLKKRAEKVRLCAEQRIPLVEWDAAVGDPLPSLPAPHKGGAGS